MYFLMFYFHIDKTGALGNVPSLFIFVSYFFHIFSCFIFISTKHAPKIKFLLFSHFFAQTFYIFFYLDKTGAGYNVPSPFIFLYSIVSQFFMFYIHIFFTKKPKFEHSISIFGFSSPIVEVVMVQRVSYASNQTFQARPMAGNPI